MRILVTGAAGFIGAALCRKLSEAGNDIIAGIDNLNAYYDPRLKIRRLISLGFTPDPEWPVSEVIPCSGSDRRPVTVTDLPWNKELRSETLPNLTFIRMDLTDQESLDTLCGQQHFDIIVNLAAQAGVRYSIENPASYIRSNIDGFLNILECARHHNVRHLIYASSSSVYGGNTKIPFSEEDRTDTPVSLYAATKKSDELMAEVYSRLYDIPCTGLRFFTVYGPWGRPDMAPMLFADAIMKGEPIKVFNNGDMSRDFTYIDDIVEGIIRVIDTTATRESSCERHKVYNIGRGEPVRLPEFISLLETALGKKGIKEMRPMQPGDVACTYADTTRLRRDTGYSPQTSLREGIEKFAAWRLKDLQG